MTANELAAELRRWVTALERRQAFDPKKLAALLRRIADYLEEHTCVDTPDSTE